MTFLRDGDDSVSLGEKFLTEISTRFESGAGGLQSLVAAARDPEGDLPEDVAKFAANLIGDDALSELLEALGHPVSDIPAEGLAWSWSREGVPHVPSGELTLELGYDVGFGVKVLPGPVAVLSGELGLGGSFMLPFDFGSCGFMAEGQGSAEIEATFAHADPNTRLHRALGEDLPVVTQLTDPQALLGRPTLRGIRLSTRGQVRLGGSLQAGRSFRIGRSEDGAPGAIRAIGTVGAAYTIDWARGGEYEILVEPDEARLRVTLRDQDSARLKRSLSVGASIQVEGLETVVAPVIEDYAGFPHPVSAFVERWSRPSALLEQWVRSALGEGDAGLAAILLDAGAGQPVGDRLEAMLVEKLTGAVDERAESWTALLRGDVERLADRVLATLSRRLPEELEERAREELSDLLDEAAVALREELTKQIGELVRALRASAPVAGVERELAHIAEAGGEVLADADQEAARLVAPVTALLERVRAARDKLLAAVDSITRDELGLRLVREAQTGVEHQALLTLTLDPAVPEARELYQAMLAGDFRQAMLVGMDDAVPYVTLESGVMKEHLFHRRSTGFELNLFGISAGSQRILGADLQVEYSIDGTVSVFDSRTTLERVRRWRAESQHVLFASNARLAAARTDGYAPFAVRLSYEDDDLEVTELRAFLSRLEAAQLLSPGATENALRSYDSLGVPDSDGSRALNVQLALPVSGEELTALASTPREEVLRTAIATQVRLHRKLRRIKPFRWAVSRLESGSVEQIIFDEVGHTLGRVRRDIADRFGVPRGSVAFRSTSSGFVKFTSLVYRIAQNAEGLADYLSGMVEFLNELDALRVPDGAPISPDAAAALEERHRSLVEDLSGWSSAEFGIDLFKPERLSISTVAFLATLRALGAGGQAIVPIVSWLEDGRPQKVLFG